MGREFWRTIRTAIEKDNWTARLVVVFLTVAVVVGGHTVAVKG
ncbi:hypothetical protein [Streptomyces sp. NPDC046976]